MYVCRHVVTSYVPLTPSLTCVYSNISMHAGLDSVSEWLKSNKSDYSSPSSSSTSSPQSAPSSVSDTRDRLLHSEIRELQVKLAQLEKENHELRQLLRASGDESRAALLGRQVMYMYVHVYVHVCGLLFLHV